MTCGSRRSFAMEGRRREGWANQRTGPCPVASPTSETWNRLVGWLRSVEGLRRMAALEPRNGQELRESAERSPPDSLPRDIRTSERAGPGNGAAWPLPACQPELHAVAARGRATIRVLESARERPRRRKRSLERSRLPTVSDSTAPPITTCVPATGAKPLRARRSLQPS